MIARKAAATLQFLQSFQLKIDGHESKLWKLFLVFGLAKVDPIETTSRLEFGIQAQIVIPQLVPSVRALFSRAGRYPQVANFRRQSTNWIDLFFVQQQQQN